MEPNEHPGIFNEEVSFFLNNTLYSSVDQYLWYRGGGRGGFDQMVVGLLPTRKSGSGEESIHM